MELKKKSRLIRFAYPFGDEPRQTSVCRMFWRSIGMALIGWPLMLALGVVAAVVGAIVLCAMMLINAFFGHYVIVRRKKYAEDFGIEKLENVPVTRPMPWLPSVGTARIAPSAILLPATWLFGYRPAMYPEDEGYFAKMRSVWEIGIFEVKPIYPLALLSIATVMALTLDEGQLRPIAVISGAVIGGIVVVAIFLAALIFGIRRLRDSDAIALAREYVKARKEQVCPTIYIVD